MFIHTIYYTHRYIIIKSEVNPSCQKKSLKHLLSLSLALTSLFILPYQIKQSFLNVWTTRFTRKIKKTFQDHNKLSIPQQIQSQKRRKINSPTYPQNFAQIIQTFDGNQIQKEIKMTYKPTVQIAIKIKNTVRAYHLSVGPLR